MSFVTTIPVVQDEYFCSKYGESVKLSQHNYTVWALFMELLLVNAKCLDITLGVEHPPERPPQSLAESTSSGNNSSSSSAPASHTTRSGAQAESTAPENPPSTNQQRKFKKKLEDYHGRVACASALIFRSLSSRTISYIGNKRNPHEMWQALKGWLDRTIRGSGISHLRARFQKDKLKETESVADFMNQLIDIQTWQSISNSALICQILHSLSFSSKFGGVVRNIRDRPQSELSIDYVFDALLEHEDQNITEPSTTQCFASTAPPNRLHDLQHNRQRPNHHN